MVWILSPTTGTLARGRGVWCSCLLEIVCECRDDARHQVVGARHSPRPQARHPRLRQGQGATGVLPALPEAPLPPRQALQVCRRPGEAQIW